MTGSKKYSISLPENLAESARERAGVRGLSAYVAQALEHRIAMDKLAEIIADFETNNEPLTPQEMATAYNILGWSDARRHVA